MDTQDVSARTSVAMLDVLAERVRQVRSEGWTEAHDDAHQRREMALAAACYAAAPLRPAVRIGGEWREMWPWADEWDKRDRHDQRRRLVIAAALLVAEIERLDRRTERMTVGRGRGGSTSTARGEDSAGRGEGPDPS